MRDYAKVAPSFWMGETGRWIRTQGKDCVIVALYLLTCPNSSMIGLYYLPLVTLAHETGLTIEESRAALAKLQEAPSKPLRSPFEGGFAWYDEVQEVVWVPQMARFQIGERLAPKDNKVIGIKNEAAKWKKCRFFVGFVGLYNEAYNLDFPIPEPETRSPFEAPSKPLRSQEQEQEQEQETDQEKEQELGPGRKEVEPPVSGEHFKPLPLWQALVKHAGAKLRLERKSSDTTAGIPYADFSNFTHAAAALAKREPAYEQAHYELAGAWIAAGGLDWHAKNNTPPWKRVCERLEQVLSAAEEWHRSGRKTLPAERAPPPDQSWRNPKIGERRDNTQDLMTWANQRKLTTSSEE